MADLKPTDPDDVPGNLGDLRKALFHHGTDMTADELADEILSTARVRVIEDPPLLPLDDAGNGQRLAEHFGTDLRYCALTRDWFVWDKRRWERSVREEEKLRAIDVAMVIEAEGSKRKALEAQRIRKRMESGELTEPEALKAVAAAEKAIDGTTAKAKRRARSGGGVRTTLELGRAHPPIPVTVSDLDRPPFLINCPNGTVDLSSSCPTARPHRREDMLTKMTGVAMVASHPCPEWMAFLRWVTRGDDDLTGYLQRLFGYAMIGEVHEHVLPVFYGGGGNGKGVLLEVMMAVLGDYAMPGASGMLEDRGSDRHPTDIADLAGARMVVLSENERQVRLKEGLVKLLTGGDTIKGRFMRQDFFRFTPSHTLILAVNNKPVVGGTDNGIWRRLQLVPFDATVDPKDIDTNKARRMIKEEGPGILAWAAWGAVEWRRHGLRPPEAVLHASAEYRQEMDVVGQFLDECCDQVAGTWCPASGIYLKYRGWCEDMGLKPETENWFGRQLTDRGVERKRVSGGKRGYKDIRIKVARAEERWAS